MVRVFSDLIRVRENSYSGIFYTVKRDKSWVLDWITWCARVPRLEALSLSFGFCILYQLMSWWITTDLLVWDVEKHFSSLSTSRNSNRLQRVPKYLVQTVKTDLPKTFNWITHNLIPTILSHAALSLMISKSLQITVPYQVVKYNDRISFNNSTNFRQD